MKGKSEEIRKRLDLFLLDKNPPIEVREEVNKRSKEKEELEKKLDEIRLKIRRKESTVIDLGIIKDLKNFIRFILLLDQRKGRHWQGSL